MIHDKREMPFEMPWGFVVFTDSFMSGWGMAPGRSLYALPYFSHEDMVTLLDNGSRRSEMKRARIVSANKRGMPTIRLKDGDHLSIADRHAAAPWYAPGSFCKTA